MPELPFISNQYLLKKKLDIHHLKRNEYFISSSQCSTYVYMCGLLYCIPVTEAHKVSQTDLQRQMFVQSLVCDVRD